jgi:hypothetical protein
MNDFSAVAAPPQVTNAVHHETTDREVDVNDGF